MKRIILFIPSLITGGAEKFVTDLAIRIDKELFSVKIAVVSDISPPGYSGNRFPELLDNCNVDVYKLKGRNKLCTVFNIFRLLSMQRPDVIHTSLSSLYYVMVPAFIYGVKKRVHTFHNMPSFTAKGVNKYLYKIAFNLLNFVPVAVSCKVKEKISEYFKIPLLKIQCIYNGVDTKTFYPTVRHYCSKAVSFISVGSLTPVKNHRLLIDAFASAAQKCSDIRLTILGEGELKEELLTQIDAYGLSGIINIPGVAADVSVLLNCADIYVMSSDTEGLPLSVLEAMAAGLPIVATEAGGIADIVSHRENGFISPIGDAEALSAAMVRLALDADLRRSMGEAARRKALCFDYSYCVKRYQELYMGV